MASVFGTCFATGGFAVSAARFTARMLMMRNGKMDFFTGGIPPLDVGFGTCGAKGFFRRSAAVSAAALRGASVERLRVAALGAEEMQGVAAHPGVGGVADRALRFLREEGAFAV